MQLPMYSHIERKQTKPVCNDVKQRKTPKKSSSHKVTKDSLQKFCRNHLNPRKNKKHKQNKNVNLENDECTEEFSTDIGRNDRRLRKYKNEERLPSDCSEPVHHPCPADVKSTQLTCSVLSDQYICPSSLQTIDCNTPEEKEVQIQSTHTQEQCNSCCDKFSANNLYDERLRLITFTKYPDSSTKSAVRLANSGFVYSGTGQEGDDSVTCVFCRVRIEHWNIQDDVQEVHRERSPHCVMVSDSRHSPNISISSSCTESLNFDIILQELDSQRDLVELDSKHSVQEQCHPHFHGQTNNTCLSIPRVRENVSNYKTNVATSLSHLNSTLSTHEVTSTSASSQISSHREASPLSASPSSPSPVSASPSSPSPVSASPSSPSPVSASPSSPRPVSQLHSNSQVQVPSQHQPHSNGSDATLTSNRVNTTIVSTAAATSQTTHENSTTHNNTLSSPLPQTTTSSQPSSTSQSKTNSPSFTELGIITERPKRTEFAIKSERLKSFSSWPQGHFLIPADLADAGFYFAGFGDCARCFYCGGGLRNWDNDDDVWVEHARWFPKCAFIRNKMGQAFVDAVSELNKTHEKIPFDLVVNEMGALNFDSNLDPRKNPLNRDPAVKTAIDLGYKETDVIEIAHELKDNDVMLSADVLLEKLQEEGKMHSEHLLNLELSTISPLDIETTRQMKEKNNQLRQQTVCKICLENEVAVVFLPCGHLVSCTECSSAVRNCPMCRAPVKGVVRAFLN
ncbi:Baculoviral IAP repeat-containing protein 7-A [Bulinus truncatus]|nr:Baculoviral IAP repeat-containing protein 7-A [Bulinus truncatus]